MKTLKLLSFFALTGLVLTSCSDDDPEPVNEEEVITTMTITLVPQGGGTAVQLQSRDLDGDGPEPPVITVSGNFSARTIYNGSIVLLNETETPPENITLEVEEEGDKHQFFYTIGASLSAQAEHLNVDGNGNPLGTEFIFAAGDESTGDLSFTLRHDLKKPNDGTLADAGGETDIAQTFPVGIE